MWYNLFYHRVWDTINLTTTLLALNRNTYVYDRLILEVRLKHKDLMMQVKRFVKKIFIPYLHEYGL